MTALICMVTCWAIFSTDVQAAQKTVRVKEKTEITYEVAVDGSKEKQNTVRTEYTYGETGNLQQELVYKANYFDEEEYLWKERTYYDNGVLKSSSGMTSPINLQSYESHYDQYGHLMEPSSSMVDFYVYEEYGVLYPFYEYNEEYDEAGEKIINREYDSEGRLTRFEVTLDVTPYDSDAWTYICSYEYQYDPEGRIRFVFGKVIDEDDENPIISTRAFEYQEDGNYLCKYTSYGEESYPEAYLMEFRPDGRLIRLTYGIAEDEDLTTDYSRITFDYDENGYWKKIMAVYNSGVGLDYDLTYRMDGGCVVAFDVFSNIETRLWDYPVLEGHEHHSEFEYDEYGNVSRIREIPKGIVESVLDGEWYETEYQYDYETVYALKEDTMAEKHGKEAVERYIETHIRLS